MLQRFPSGQQFDGQQIFGKIDNRSEFQGAGHSHRNVILFSAGGGHIVDACRMGEHFRFIEQRSRGDMRDHKTRLRTGMSGEKCGQSLVHIWINQALDPALTDAYKVRDRDRDVIKRKRERRTMKVTA